MLCCNPFSRDFLFFFVLFLHKSLHSIYSVAYVIDQKKKVLHRLIQNYVSKETHASVESYKDVVRSCKNAFGKLLRANVELLDIYPVGPELDGDR